MVLDESPACAVIYQAPRGGARAARSISPVAAASAPSQQQQQATVVSRDHERSMGLLCGNDVSPTSDYLFFRIILQKELRSLDPEGGGQILFDNFCGS